MDRIKWVCMLTVLIGLHGAGQVDARCCDIAADGCSSASEMGCAMGDPLDMFFPDPCVCDSGSCVDPTQGNASCGGQVPGDCGDGSLDAGEECDDGMSNGTFDSCCTMGCTFKSNGALCEDGTFCDGLGACNGSGTCTANAGGLPCDGADGDSDCTETCNEGNRDCNDPDPDGSMCSDFDACTEDDQCMSGACMGTEIEACIAGAAPAASPRMLVGLMLALAGLAVFTLRSRAVR